MNRFFICLLVLLSLVATPVLAGGCVDDGRAVTTADNYDGVSKQQSGNDGKLVKGMAHCCVCVHAVGVSNQTAVYIALISEPVFLAVQDSFAPDHNPAPILEPPSHA